MKQAIFSMCMMLALMTVGLVYFIGYPAKAAAWQGNFSSMPESYSSLVYASMPARNQLMGRTSLGPYGSSWSGCITGGSGKQDNGADKLSIGKVSYISSGKSSTWVARTRERTNAGATVTTSHIDLLQGLITADWLQATVNSWMNASDTGSSVGGAAFSHLAIGGKAIGDRPWAGSKEYLYGIGYVVLNEQTQTHTYNMTHISLNMLHVYVTQQNKRLPVGSEIMIGHVETTITRTAQPHVLRSYLYDYNAYTGAGWHGPTVDTRLSCTGGSTQRDAVSVLPATLGHTGLTDENTTGRIKSSDSNANGVIHIANVNLLRGLINIESIDASAHVMRTSKAIHYSTASLMNAHIGDTTFRSAVKHDTRVTLKGIGYVVLNEQASKVTSSLIEQQVNALDIHVTQRNNLGLSVGTRIIIGHVDVGISTY